MKMSTSAEHFNWGTCVPGHSPCSVGNTTFGILHKVQDRSHVVQRTQEGWWLSCEAAQQTNHALCKGVWRNITVPNELFLVRTSTHDRTRIYLWRTVSILAASPVQSNTHVVQFSLVLLLPTLRLCSCFQCTRFSRGKTRLTYACRT